MPGARSQIETRTSFSPEAIVASGPRRRREQDFCALGREGSQDDVEQGGLADGGDDRK